jgi:hypothetical protein
VSEPTKQWRVVVTRDVTMSAVLTVEAESAEDANDKALEMAARQKRPIAMGLGRLRWQRPVSV